MIYAIIIKLSLLRTAFYPPCYFFQGNNISKITLPWNINYPEKFAQYVFLCCLASIVKSMLYVALAFQTTHLGLKHHIYGKK